MNQSFLVYVAACSLLVLVWISKNQTEKNEDDCTTTVEDGEKIQNLMSPMSEFSGENKIYLWRSTKLKTRLRKWISHSHISNAVNVVCVISAHSSRTQGVTMQTENGILAKNRELGKSAQSWIREEREASLVAVLTNWNAESEREYQKGKKLRTPRKTFSGHLRFFFSFFYGIRRRFESTSQQVFRADSHGNQIKIPIVGEISERRQQSCFLRKVDFKHRKREKLFKGNLGFSAELFSVFSFSY